MHLAAGWSFRHRRTVLTGWPPPSSPAQAGQMNASRTAAFASLAPVAAAQDVPEGARPPVAGRPQGTARRRRPDPQWPLDPRGPGPVQQDHQEHPVELGPAVITSHPRTVARAARACQAPGLPPPRRCRPAGGRAVPILRSGRIRASTPPLICSTGISWQGCGSRVTSCPPTEVPRTGDSSSNPGDPIHYEFNLV